MENNSIVFNNDNPFIDYREEINNLNFNKTCGGQDISSEYKLSPKLNANLREVMEKILDFSTNIGGKMIDLGKKLLNIIFEAIKRFPNTCCGLLIVGTLHSIASQVPLIGRLISGLLLPFDCLILGLSFFKDLFKNGVFDNFLKTAVSFINKTIA